jgi:hypothetical protein
MSVIVMRDNLLRVTKLATTAVMDHSTPTPLEVNQKAAADLLAASILCSKVANIPKDDFLRLAGEQWDMT